MKRIFLYALTIAAVSLIGCSKEEVKPSSTSGMTLSANVSEPTTKATISDDWKFSFEQADVVKVTNSNISGTYYTFTKGTTNFTSTDAQTTSTAADWYAFFPGNTIDLTNQGGTKDNAADCFGYAGKQENVAAHTKALSITMAPQMSVIKVVNNKGSISLNAQTGAGNYITGMTASTDGPTFTVTTSTTASDLLSKTETGTYYIAVPSLTAFDIYDGTTKLKSIAAGKLVAGNYYTLTIGSSTTDLSKDGNANCYIVSTAGTYKFKTVQGNSSTPVGTVASAAVLWESYGTATAPTAGDLIKADVSYANDYITFSTNGTYRKGNAVIAAKDASGNILWSWHIWLTDKPADQVYNNSAGTMMDRNLGATSATAGADGSCGLLYQWGRKDPFIGGSHKTTPAASTPKIPTAVESASSHLTDNNTLAYSIANPTTFLTSYNDWYCTEDQYLNDYLWKNAYGSPKTIYDPCPVGYRVPDGGNNGVWPKAFGSTAVISSNVPWNSTNKGMDFGSGNGKDNTKQLGSATTIWYPVTGNINYNTGQLNLNSYVKEGFYWSCTASNTKWQKGACRFDFSDTTINPSNFQSRAYGSSVRCLKE